MTTYEERKHLPIGGYDHGYDDAADALVADENGFGPCPKCGGKIDPATGVCDLVHLDGQP